MRNIDIECHCRCYARRAALMIYSDIDVYSMPGLMLPCLRQMLLLMLSPPRCFRRCDYAAAGAVTLIRHAFRAVLR